MGHQLSWASLPPWVKGQLSAPVDLRGWWAGGCSLGFYGDDKIQDAPGTSSGPDGLGTGGGEPLGRLTPPMAPSVFTLV